MDYLLIALDLDGTLLTRQKRILPESLTALRQARDAGLQVMVVTDRHHVAIHPFYSGAGDRHAGDLLQRHLSLRLSGAAGGDRQSPR